MKGFKDSSGKFRPTENKTGIRMRRDQTTKTEGVKFDGLGRRLPLKLAKIGDIAQVSEGSGINSGKVGLIIGKKPAEDFPQSSHDWYQVKVIKPEVQKGIIIQVPKDRLEKRMKRITKKISDDEAFKDYWQEMGERGASFEVLQDAGISANEAVKGTPDEGTNMEYWHIAPLVVNKTAQAKIIRSRGGIDEIKEFLAYNAEWEKYKKELESA